MSADRDTTILIVAELSDFPCDCLSAAGLIILALVSAMTSAQGWLDTAQELRVTCRLGELCGSRNKL